MVKDRETVALCDFASVTCSVNVDVPIPDVLGVPEITPVVGFNVRPVGRRPAMIDHVYEGVPPATGIVMLYDLPLVPPVNETAIIVGRGFDAFGSATMNVSMRVEQPNAESVPSVPPQGLENSAKFPS